MRTCPLCGLEIDDTDLTRYYLSDPGLIAYIESQNRNWKLSEGACSRCLESAYRNWKSTQADGPTDEKTIITTQKEALGEKTGSMGGACLIVIHGADLGKKYDLFAGEYIIGRSEASHIRVNEENVSRQHAKVYEKKKELVIEDLGSTNGTYVNTKKITTQSLHDGDLVLVGNTILKFVSGSNVEQQYHEEIYRLATMDGLTRLYNRSFFLDRLSEEFSRSKRYGRALSMLLFDFDHFKQLNDTFGHRAGDDVLRQSAALILKNMRKEDVCGRYGGEEFGVLLPETPLEIAVTLADKIRSRVEVTSFQHEGKLLKVTISVGVGSLSEKIEDTAQFLEQADQALYQAKKDGRNCVRPKV